MTPERHIPLTPEQAAEAERRSDQGVMNGYMARAAIEGAYPDLDHQAPPASRRRRTSHRGGRSYPDEITGQDASRAIANQFALEHPVSADQPEVNARGRETVNAALDEAFGKDRHIKAIQAKVEQLIPIDPDNVAKSEADRERLLTALLRAHFDSKQ